MGWRTLCETSYAFHVPLKDMLEGNIEAVQTSVERPLPFMATERKVRKRAEAPQTEMVQQCLQSLLKGGYPILLSMAAVGKSLNVEPREIRRLVSPELYKIASENLKKRMNVHRRWQHEFRWNNIQLVLKAFVERQIHTHHQITRREMVGALNAAGLWPSFNETPALWKLLADAKRLVEQEREVIKLGGTES